MKRSRLRILQSPFKKLIKEELKRSSSPAIPLPFPPKKKKYRIDPFCVFEIRIVEAKELRPEFEHEVGEGETMNARVIHAC